MPGQARSSFQRAASAGFTLIELLVVMVIIAMLLTIATPRYFNQIDQARDQSLQHSLAVMRDAIDKYRADTGSYPADLEELVSKRYLRSVPRDPVTESSLTWVFVPPPNPEDTGIWDVRSGARGVGRNGIRYADW